MTNVPSNDEGANEATRQPDEQATALIEALQSVGGGSLSIAQNFKTSSPMSVARRPNDASNSISIHLSSFHKTLQHSIARCADF
jgi:hypothetical protein